VICRDPGPPKWWTAQVRVGCGEGGGNNGGDDGGWLVGLEESTGTEACKAAAMRIHRDNNIIVMG